MARPVQGRRPLAGLTRPLVAAALQSPSRLDGTAEAEIAGATPRTSCPGRRLRAGSAGRSRPSAGCCAGSVSAASRRSSPPPVDPLRARAAGRADPYRHQEARPDRRRRPPHHRRPARPEQPTRPRRTAGMEASRRRRRRLPARLHRSPARREEGERLRLPRPRARLLRQPWRLGRARHDRQRIGLSQPPLPPRSPRQASATTAPGPTRRAPTARPSASSRPPCANGPTPPLPDLRQANPSHAAVDRRLQYSTTSLRSRRQTSHLTTEQGQRPWKRQLV